MSIDLYNAYHALILYSDYIQYRRMNLSDQSNDLIVDTDRGLFGGMEKRVIGGIQLISRKMSDVGDALYDLFDAKVDVLFSIVRFFGDDQSGDGGWLLYRSTVV